MVRISAVSRSPCLGACNANLPPTYRRLHLQPPLLGSMGLHSVCRTFFCRDTMTSLTVFYCCHHSVGRWNPFLSPGTESPWGPTVRLPRERHATWTLCLHSIILPISPFLRGDVSRARLYPVNNLTYEPNLRMSVLQNGSDGPYLPAFTDALS